MSDSQNPRKQLKASIERLTSAARTSLAVSFVNHAVRNFPDAQRSAAEIVLKKLAEFMEGRTTINDFQEVYSAFYDAQTDVLQASMTLSNLGCLIRLCVLACCQRDLEAAKLIYRNRFQPSLLDVAVKCACMVRMTDGSQKAEHEWQLEQIQEMQQNGECDGAP